MHAFMKKMGSGFYLDHRSLAAFRIALGFFLLWDLIIRARDISVHYTDSGLLPRITAIETFRNTTDFCLHLMTGSLFGQSLIFISHALVLCSLILGYRTRLSSILSWLLIVSLHSRNELLQHGGDHYLRILSFWAMFLPLGGHFSIDSIKRPGQAPRFLSTASIVFILQMCAVYWLAAAQKIGPEWTTDYSALQYALNISFFSQPFGKWLLHYPALLGFLTRSTLWLEYICPFFFFMPFFNTWFRVGTIVILFTFHMMIGLTLYLGSLPYVFMIPLIAIVPSVFWEFKSRFNPKTLARGRRSNISFAGPLFRHVASMIRRMARPAASFLIIVLGIYQLLENIETLPGKPQVIPKSLQWVGTTLRIDQNWGMFAPYPYKIHGWYVIQTEGVSGVQKQSVQGREPASSNFKRPMRVTSLFPNGHWLTFAINIYAEHPELFPSWAQSICANDRTGTGEQVASVEVYFMKLFTETDFSQSFPYKERIGHYDCVTESNEEAISR